MTHLYGTFTENQIAAYKKSMHTAVHWCLIHKENNDEYLDEYIENLIIRVSGLNHALNYPNVMVSIIAVLQALRDENSREDCDFKKYRKLVFDAHDLIDMVKEE